MGWVAVFLHIETTLCLAERILAFGLHYYISIYSVGIIVELNVVLPSWTLFRP